MPFATYAEEYLDNSKFSNLSREKKVYVQILDHLIYQLSESLRLLREANELNYILQPGFEGTSKRLHSLVSDIIDPNSPKPFYQFSILQIHKTIEIVRTRKHMADYFVNEKTPDHKTILFEEDWEKLLKKYMDYDDFIDRIYMEHFLEKFLFQLRSEFPDTYKSIVNGYFEKYFNYSYTIPEDFFGSVE